MKTELPQQLLLPLRLVNQVEGLEAAIFGLEADVRAGRDQLLDETRGSLLGMLAAASAVLRGARQHVEVIEGTGAAEVTPVDGEERR